MPPLHFIKAAVLFNRATYDTKTISNIPNPNFGESMWDSGSSVKLGSGSTSPSWKLTAWLWASYFFSPPQSISQGSCKGKMEDVQCVWPWAFGGKVGSYFKNIIIHTFINHQVFGMWWYISTVSKSTVLWYISIWDTVGVFWLSYSIMDILKLAKVWKRAIKMIGGLDSFAVAINYNLLDTFVL